MDKQQDKKTSFTTISGDQGMVCGPEGCKLEDHFDWAKKATQDKNKDNK